LRYWYKRVEVLVEVLVSEGWGTGVRGLRYWLRYCIRGLGYWCQRVEVLVEVLVSEG